MHLVSETVFNPLKCVWQVFAYWFWGSVDAVFGAVVERSEGRMARAREEPLTLKGLVWLAQPIKKRYVGIKPLTWIENVHITDFQWEAICKLRILQLQTFLLCTKTQGSLLDWRL